MMRHRMHMIVVAALVLVLFAAVSFAEKKGGVELITKEELVKLLDDPAVVILDVRRGTDWRASEFMIKGAIRLEAGNISKVDYPKNFKLVLYCA